MGGRGANLHRIMNPKTFTQLMQVVAFRRITIEQIALREITLRVGRMRWTVRLMADGLWHNARAL
jgi:hypothetical protein